MDVREELASIRNDLQYLVERDNKPVVNLVNRKQYIVDMLARLDEVLNYMGHEEERLLETIGDKQLSEHELALIALMVKDMVR